LNVDTFYFTSSNHITSYHIQPSLRAKQTQHTLLHITSHTTPHTNSLLHAKQPQILTNLSHDDSGAGATRHVAHSVGLHRQLHKVTSINKRRSKPLNRKRLSKTNITICFFTQPGSDTFVTTKAINNHHHTNVKMNDTNPIQQRSTTLCLSKKKDTTERTNDVLCSPIINSHVPFCKHKETFQKQRRSVDKKLCFSPSGTCLAVLVILLHDLFDGRPDACPQR
jgi:hypothetical protein